jgi:hypothetical protein
MWMAQNEAQLEFLNEAIAEIEGQSDRTAAIVAAALIDDGLETAIKSRLHRDKDIEHRMFEGLGPLASYSAKVNLGTLMGVIAPAFHDTLVRIGTIRNKFAHSARKTTFASQQIADLCKNFPGPTRSRRSPRPKENASQDQFTRYILSGFQAFKDSPRNRFMSAAALVLTMLRINTVQHEISQKQKSSHDISAQQQSRSSQTGNRARKKPTRPL